MPSPLRSEVHVNRPLSTVSTAIIQDANEYVCDKAFPVVSVAKESDLYFNFDRSYWFRTGAMVRAPGTESAGGGFRVRADQSYYCRKMAYHMDVSDELIVNADAEINVLKTATDFVTRNVLLRREKDFFARYFVPNVWGGFGMTNTNGVFTTSDFSPAIAWSADNSNPMADIAALQTEIKRNTSLDAKTMIVGHDVNARLKQHPLVLRRLKTTDTGIADEVLLAQLFCVDKYLVASAVENVVQEGQTPAYDFMMTGKILLVHAAKAPGLMVASAGYTFSWTGLLGASALGSRIKTFRMEHLESTRVESEVAYDQKLVSKELGVLGVNIL